MKKFYWRIQQLRFVIAVLLVSKILHAQDTQETEITSAVCKDFTMYDIPVGDFASLPQMPEAVMRITQTYDNSEDDGYCNANGSQPPALSTACTGKRIYYGHDGIDIHSAGATEGMNSIYSTQDAIVIVSHKYGTKTGWGESMILATRTNRFSQEIITHHYHHLYAREKNYLTSRRFNACDQVVRGDEIALEGRSGPTVVHLHHTIRRWANLQALKTALKNNGSKVYGYGYSFGDDNKLKGFLDPLGVLYNTYRDYTSPTVSYAWSLPYVLEMRRQGIEFGLFNGNFGAEQNVLRREAARWIKIAAEVDGATESYGTFGDLDEDDQDSIYVEALTRFPSHLPVINPNHTCTNSGQNFCPESTVNRAEALKMIVLAFYPDEFFRLYDNAVWKTSYSLALALLSQFDDVDPLVWYAPYVIFGMQKGIIAERDLFYPSNVVTRAEFAKWLIEGLMYVRDTTGSFCSNIICGAEEYCDEELGTCANISQCIPSETETCEVGGGYVEPEDPEIPPDTLPATTCGSGKECSPGYQQSQTCNNSGMQIRICGADCLYGNWSVCTAPVPECDYYELPQETRVCAGSGSQTRTCIWPGTWSAWSDCPITTQDAGAVIDAGPESDANTSTDSGTVINPPDPPDASTPSCTDTFIAGAERSCLTTDVTTICLELDQIDASNWKYRVCKEGGTFNNAFTYQLVDENNYVFFDTLNGVANSSCTGWVQIDVGYISGFGSTYGAGLVAKIISPSGCTSSFCQFRSGSITIRKDCI